MQPSELKKAGKRWSSRLSLIAVLLTILVYSIIAISLDKHTKHRVIIWDMFGYYAYLPATFIYNDLEDLEFVPDMHVKYMSADGQTEYGTTRQPNGKRVMKYTAGLSILYSPFFFLGHAIANHTNHDADGFSKPYQFAMVLCSLFYACIGLLVIRAVLLYFFNDWVAALVIILIAFGTNYYFYVVDEGMMAHNYLYLLLGLLILATIRWHEKPSLGYALLIGFALGMSILIRPTEVLFSIVPVMWGISSRHDLIPQVQKFLQHWKHVLIAGLVIILICSVQAVYWKYATGQWLYYSYKGEGHFDFRAPHIWQGLFSFRKGWFVYTPLMLFAIIGIWYMRRQLPQFLPGIIIFSILYIYVVFSWNPWWYGGSFGMRSMVQTYALFSIPLACFITAIFTSRFRGMLFALVCGFLIYLNLFQSWQRQHNIIHWENMNREWYWDVFLSKEHSKEFSIHQEHSSSAQLMFTS